MRVSFDGVTKSWVVSESGEHSANVTSIQLKRGINPLFLTVIDAEIERDTAPKAILTLLRKKKWTDDAVTLPTVVQISNRKSHLVGKVEGPLTQYKYAVNLIKWVEDNMLRNKEHYAQIADHQYFTMGFVEYTKNTNKGPEPAIAFAYTTKG